MKTLSLIMRQSRERMGLTEQQVAVFVGISRRNYIDLEWWDEEYSILTTIEIVRLAVLYQIPFEEFLSPLFDGDHWARKGTIRLPVDVDAVFPDTEQRFDKAGWEEAVKDSFKSLDSFGQMPIIALLDICAEYGYSPLNFLANFDEAFRWRRATMTPTTT